MLSAQWMRRRQPYWSRLESLLQTCGRGGISALSPDELREMALLYRQTAADLSSARGDPSSAALSRHLNDMMGRAHNLLYAPQPTDRRAVLTFYASTFPRVVRECHREILLATASLLSGAALGAVLSLSEPGFDRFLLGAGMIDTIERGEMWTHSIVTVKPLASSGIMTNNLVVAFTAYATGMLAGLGTLYFMLLNGVLLGVVAAACYRGGMSLALWSFVAPHGALELPAICLAGAAGLVLARAILFPGNLPRKTALAAAGSRSLRLMLGVIPMLVVAGVIEGFISPTAVPAPFKFAIGGGLTVLLAVYLAVAGRTGITEDSAS
jgi:uncharacterized membrane protein SpoIIM required for sporulation